MIEPYPCEEIPPRRMLSGTGQRLRIYLESFMEPWRESSRRSLKMPARRSCEQFTKWGRTVAPQRRSLRRQHPLGEMDSLDIIDQQKTTTRLEEQDFLD